MGIVKDKRDFKVPFVSLNILMRYILTFSFSCVYIKNNIK